MISSILFQLTLVAVFLLGSPTAKGQAKEIAESDPSETSSSNSSSDRVSAKWICDGAVGSNSSLRSTDQEKKQLLKLIKWEALNSLEQKRNWQGPSPDAEALKRYRRAVAILSSYQFGPGRGRSQPSVTQYGASATRDTESLANYSSSLPNLSELTASESKELESEILKHMKSAPKKRTSSESDSLALNDLKQNAIEEINKLTEQYPTLSFYSANRISSLESDKAAAAYTKRLESDIKSLEELSLDDKEASSLILFNSAATILGRNRDLCGAYKDLLNDLKTSEKIHEYGSLATSAVGIGGCLLTGGWICLGASALATAGNGLNYVHLKGQTDVSQLGLAGGLTSSDRTRNLESRSSVALGMTAAAGAGTALSGASKAMQAANKLADLGANSSEAGRVATSSGTFDRVKSIARLGKPDDRVPFDALGRSAQSILRGDSQYLADVGHNHWWVDPPRLEYPLLVEERSLVAMNAVADGKPVRATEMGKYSLESFNRNLDSWGSAGRTRLSQAMNSPSIKVGSETFKVVNPGKSSIRMPTEGDFTSAPPLKTNGLTSAEYVESMSHGKAIRFEAIDKPKVSYIGNGMTNFRKSEAVINGRDVRILTEDGKIIGGRYISAGGTDLPRGASPTHFPNDKIQVHFLKVGDEIIAVPGKGTRVFVSE